MKNISPAKKNIKWIVPCSRIIKDNKFTRQFDARVSCMHEELLKPAMPGKKKKRFRHYDQN